MMTKFGFAAVLSLSLCAAAGALAQGSETPIRTLSLHVGTAAGGTNDMLMRLVGRHIGKHLPGNPQVLPKNMPGAGGRKLAAYLFHQAPANGSELGVFQRAVTTDPLLVDPKLLFDVPKFTWIGSPSSTTDICAVWHTSPVQSIEDLRTTELILAGSGGETAQVNLVRNLLGGKMKAIIGYQGGAEMMLALQRGEAFGRCALSWEASKTQYKQLLDDKQFKPIVQFALSKAADLPDVPLITDYAKTDRDRQALEIILAPQEVGFPFVGPPGLTPAITALLRKAFVDSMNDPELIAEAEKLSFELRPVGGEHLEQRMKSVYAFPPAVVARAKELIGEN